MLSAQALSEALERAWEAVQADRESDRYGGVRGEPGFWRSFLNRVRSVLDGGTVSEEAFARLAAHFRNPTSWAIYEDVLPTLDILGQRGLRLGVVSNWDSQLPRLLEGLGLFERFGSVVVSAIEETGKPDPEIFHRACARLGVLPQQALHVGDSLVEDFEGARRAGLSALLLDRLGRHAEVTDRVRTLREIPERLEGAKTSRA